MKLLKIEELSPEEKTRITADMTEAVTRICIDGIKQKNPGITEQEALINLRERIQERRT